MDELFNNIFVYLPIILIILLRILGSRNRQAGKGKPAAEPALAPEPPEKPPEQAGRPRKGSSRPPAPIPRTERFPEAPFAAAAPAKPAAGTGRAAGEGFPGNLNYLPALKRAMVLAEIMGPPKALQGPALQGPALQEPTPPGDRP
jgi:hypothetical protein